MENCTTSLTEWRANKCGRICRFPQQQWGSGLTLTHILTVNRNSLEVIAENKNVTHTCVCFPWGWAELWPGRGCGRSGGRGCGLSGAVGGAVACVELWAELWAGLWPHLLVKIQSLPLVVWCQLVVKPMSPVPAQFCSSPSFVQCSSEQLLFWNLHAFGMPWQNRLVTPCLLVSGFTEQTGSKQ